MTYRDSRIVSNNFKSTRRFILTLGTKKCEMNVITHVSNDDDDEGVILEAKYAPWDPKIVHIVYTYESICV